LEEKNFYFIFRWWEKDNHSPIDVTCRELIITEHLKKCEGAILHFWAKIAPDRPILTKLHYYELFVQNLLFHTFGPQCHVFTLFGKNHTSLQQNHTFSNLFALFQMPCNKVYRPYFTICIINTKFLWIWLFPVQTMTAG